MKKLTLTIIAFTAGIVAAGTWFIFLSPRHAPAIDVIHPARGTAIEAVYATGTVEPSVMLPIAPRVTGRLVEMNVDEGAQVAKGDVLGRLEDEDLKKTLDELRAKEVFIAKEYNRRTALAKQGYETKSNLDKARADLDAARAVIARTQTEIGYLQLMAPDDGHIIRRDGEIGQVIPANQPVFWMSCCAALRISADVDEEDISRVMPGQKVLIRADAFPDETFTGSVQAITPKGDPVSRSYRVRISLDDNDKLRIGMTAESNIVVSEKKDTLLIPNTALDGDKVWTVENNELKIKEVKTGIRGDEKAEIVSGLAEQDTVVAEPGKDLEENRKVRIRDRE